MGGKEKFVGTLILLRSRFLPATDQVVIKQATERSPNREWSLNPNPDWGVIDRFLERF